MPLTKNVLCQEKECLEAFISIEELRFHLEKFHKLEGFKLEQLEFHSKEEFKKWLAKVEEESKSKFVLSRGAKRTKSYLKQTYECHRTGFFKSKAIQQKKRLKAQGSSKIGHHCTARISVREFSSSIQVSLCKQHYGHENELCHLPVPKIEMIAENITGGVSFNDLLKDVRNNLTSETIVPLATRKRDQQILKEAFESEEYTSGLSDSESLDHWVRLCFQMEDSPVLCYRLEDNNEELLLVIMTEFQKKLLMTSEKKVICVDCVYRRNGGRFYLTCISIVDECDVALPVAFCISNKVDENVIRQFLMSVKKSTGPLSCTYFMSDSDDFYFDAWREIMDDTSKWLWSMWYMHYKFETKLRNSLKSEFEKKNEIFMTIRTLIECPSQTIFESMFQKFLDSLLVDELTAVKKFGDVLASKYSPNVERWAYCYRTDMKLSASFQLHALHRTLRFCCNEGRKTRLDKFIFVLIKFMKRKMLDRLMNILDDEKIEIVRETIHMSHKAGLDISPARISSLSDKIWLIKCEDEENVYVMRDFDSCPEQCSMQCAECAICVHMYSCSCIPSMVNASLCQHIHAVVWKFLTPHHFSPMPSPVREDNTESDSNGPTTTENNCHEMLESVLNMAHDIYKSVRENKGKLSNETLTHIKERLNEAKECIDVGLGRKVALNSEVVQQVPFSPNSDLPPRAQNSNLQPFVIQALQKPIVKGDTSQKLLPNQIELFLPQGKILSQQYVLYAPQFETRNIKTEK